MDEKKISEEDFMDVLKYGSKWHSRRIKEELDEILLNNSSNFDHEFRLDFDEKYYYIYDNECFLFVFDEKIDIRSDRQNVFSSDKTITYKIDEAKDILSAYKHFKSLTMEDEED